MARRPSTTDRLEPYRRKRDFGVTAEPEGARAPKRRRRKAGEAPTGDARFVVQRHRARRLHYDLRLEMDGVLVSWAVPKGPTLDPSSKRLAVHVEDHPLEYFDFEGVIAEGEYGAGDVIVWDWGTWEPAPGTDDPSRAVDAGELHFDLHGQKLSGRFALLRRGGHGSDDERQWILVHKHDETARDGWNAEDHPRSVLSGRTNLEIAAHPDKARRWSSDDAPAVPQRREWTAATDGELEALRLLGQAGTWTLGGYEVKLTNLDKVLFPGGGDSPPTTKRDLIAYYARIAPRILPYLAERPVNLHRYPDGVQRKGFWSKALPSNAPEWLTRWRNHEADPGETEWYAVLDRPAALAFAANQAGLELHPWTSLVSDVHRPTWAFIDIDPGAASDFDDVLALARLHRTALEHLGVRACPKVTGSRGIQIWVPIAADYSFDETRAWVEGVSKAVGAAVPELVSWAWRKDDRSGRARLDYTQNALNKTLVAPFSVRPAPAAPVSVPITWDELDDPALRPDRWTVRDVFERLDRAGDPLRPLVGLSQQLPPLE